MLLSMSYDDTSDHYNDDSNISLCQFWMPVTAFIRIADFLNCIDITSTLGYGTFHCAFISVENDSELCRYSNS